MIPEPRTEFIDEIAFRHVLQVDLRHIPKFRWVQRKPISEIDFKDVVRNLARFKASNHVQSHLVKPALQEMPR